MSDEQVPEQTPQQTQTTEPEKEVTLDDVYREAGLDKVVAPAQPAQATPVTEAPRTEPSSVPDPYDTENFKAYIARQAAGTTALQDAVTRVANYLAANERKQMETTIRTDIESAVKTIDEVVQIGKPKVIEAYLDGMVREDSRMKAIWENRSKNPSAWTNALKIAAKKMSDDFSVKVDPNLVAAQRARKDSQRQMATTAPESPDASWDGLSQEDFQRRWDAMVSGGH